MKMNLSTCIIKLISQNLAETMYNYKFLIFLKLNAWHSAVC